MNSHLFIGHHKTGSSSIQRHLAIKSQKLISKGFLYPFVDMTSILCSQLGVNQAHKQLDEMSNLQRRIHRLTMRKNYFEPHNALAFKILTEATGSPMPSWHSALPLNSQEIFKLIADQIEDSRCHSLLLVSEVLANFGATNKGLVSGFLAQLPAGGRTLHCILRRPDDYLHSWYGQELCFGYPRMGSLPMRLMNVYLSSIHFDYSLMLREWIATDDFTDIQIDDYRDICKSGGSVRWFLKSIGACDPCLLDSLSHSWVNHSLHPAFFELVRCGNTQLPQNQAISLIKDLRSLSMASQLPSANDVELLGASHRQLLFEKFLPINHYLGNVVSRPLFFADADLILLERPVAVADLKPAVVQLIYEKIDHRLTVSQRDLIETWAETSGTTSFR